MREVFIKVEKANQLNDIKDKLYAFFEDSMDDDYSELDKNISQAIYYIDSAIDCIL